MKWPTELSINAWTGEEVEPTEPDAKALAWVLGQGPHRVSQFLAPPAEADPRDWTDPEVGWGVILPEKTGLSKADLASGADAPEPIRKLIKERDNAPVFRYRATSKKRFTFLHNYRSGKSIAIDPRSPQGVGPESIPRYLLIYASPHEIPWAFQYILNGTSAVGRLDLEGPALKRYVDALLDNWTGAAAKTDHAVLWAAVDTDTITPLMRDAVAEKLFTTLDADSDLKGKVTFLDGRKNEATVEDLVESLGKSQPGLVVTTSHGMTGPLSNPTLMREQLGLLVDGDHAILDLDSLLAKWNPGGAIWYAHACCSAGADDRTIFEGLVPKGSKVDNVLQGVASVGPAISPLPKALLGAEHPLRAFVGHVEPTFDWTLKQQETGQFLTDSTSRIFYNHLYGNKAKPPDPVGLALRDWYAPLASLTTRYDEAKTNFEVSDDPEYEREMLYCRLSSTDLRSMVLLGDPTAVLPELPS